MATPTRARRGWSAARRLADRHLDSQAHTLDLLDDLQQAPRLGSEGEEVRGRYLGALQRLRPIQREWQHALECQVACAEGFAAPPTRERPSAA